MSGAGDVLGRWAEQISAVSSAGLWFGLLAGLVVVIVGLVVRSSLLVRSARVDRVEVALVPTSSFDPSPEEVMRWASQLLRTNRVTGRMAPDGARVVRVAFQSVGEGRMVQMVSGPGRAESLLRQSGLGEVELVNMAELVERIGGLDPDDPTAVDVTGGSDKADVVGQGERETSEESVASESGGTLLADDFQEAEPWASAWREQSGDGDGGIVWTSVGGER